MERLALADRSAGYADEDGNRITPYAYRQAFDDWLCEPPGGAEGALVARLMRELEVA